MKKIVVYHVVFIIALAGLLGGAGWLFGNATWGLAIANLVLISVFSYHLFYFYKLVAWLTNPKVSTVPEGMGIWKIIFDTLWQQAKSRKKRKQKLNNTLQRLNRMIATMPSGVLILDNQGRIEWKNALADAHFGLQQATDKKNILKNLVRLPKFHQFLDDAQLNPDSPATTKLTFPVHHKEHTLQLTLVPFETNAKMLISHDISANEQLNATRTAFIANVSHELRTPLTVISGFLETLADIPELDNETRQEFIELMQKESERMLTLIEDLLTLSRLENQPYQVTDLEKVNLTELINNIVNETRILAQNHHTIHAEISPDIWINGVYKDLYSALSNIAFNAVRHTPDGTTVTIGLNLADNHTAYFFVSDTGSGIAPEHLKHLTERFYRVDKGRSRKTGGSGLGLAIAKHALAEHQAILNIESQLGEGSRFSTKFNIIQ